MTASLASNAVSTILFPTLVKLKFLAKFATGVTNDFFKSLPPPARRPFNFLSGAVLFKNFAIFFTA